MTNEGEADRPVLFGSPTIPAQLGFSAAQLLLLGSQGSFSPGKGSLAGCQGHASIALA
jgi:hypothetical protein